MLDVIRRVISGEEFHDAVAATEEEATTAEEMNQQHTNTMTTQGAPTLVENDQDMDIDVDVAVDMDVGVTHIASASETPRSSLSDVSAAAKSVQEEYEQMMSEEAPMHVIREQVTTNLNQGRANLPRSDSKASSDSSNSMRGSSQNSSRDWGWFEDVHTNEQMTPHQKRKEISDDKGSKKKGKKGGRLVPLVDAGDPSHGLEIIHTVRDNEASAMAVTAPTYVLEESLSSQRLWRYTAGQRPPQPVEERAFFEKMWAQNFARSQVEYQMPVEVLTATTPISLSPFADGNFDTARGNELSNYNISANNKDSQKQDVAEATLISRLNERAPNQGASDSHQQQVVNRTVKGTGSDGDLKVLVKGDNVFGTTVSKSFARPSEKGGPIVGVDTVNISIASYRVVESSKHGKYAQFLVIYREGSIRDTIGVWKRYSDFQELSKKVTQAHEGCAAVIANMSPLAVTEEHDVEHLPNAINSWRILKKRQRWYRCLDAGYLSLKVFLLERFLHDILFESSSPNLLRDFVDAETFR